MTSLFGYHGCYLRVDLTTESVRRVPLGADVLRRYIGGAGLGTRILLAEQDGVYDALSPAAPLVFAFSPLVGSPLTTSAKFALVSKSPLTGRLNDSLCSSAFAQAGKRCGCDAVVIVGRARRPSVLLLDDGRMTLLPAGPLWGQTTSAAQARLAEQFPAGFASAVIGPAGEKLVPFATVSHDGRHAGRGGSGAVLGAKRVKAVLVRGGHRTPFADPGGLAQYSKALCSRSLGPATAKYRELGTVSNLLALNRLHALPTRSFQSGQFDAAEQVSEQRMSARFERLRKSCTACTIGCEHIFVDRQGSSAVRLEYENVYALGPLCGIDDLDTIRTASGLCDELGVDTISAGATIAFAMECRQRGWWPEFPYDFGDGDGLIKALRLIAARQGIGRRLSLGSRQMADGLDPRAAEFAPHVKGLELPGYEPRSMQLMALGYAVGSRGADHNRSAAYQVDLSSEGDRLALDARHVPLAIGTEDEAALFDSLILCKFLRGALEDRRFEMARMLRLVTGWDCSSGQLQRIARRIVSARKWFNQQQGWTSQEDRLPARFFHEPLAVGGGRQIRLDAGGFARRIAEYYELRGWTVEGRLTPDQVKDVLQGELADVAPTS